MVLKIVEENYSYDKNIITYGFVPWDSEIFGYKIFEVIDFFINDIHAINETLSGFERLLKSLDCRMVCIKLKADKMGLFLALQQNGYQFVEETIRPQISDIQKNGMDYRPLMKYPMRRVHLEQLKEIQDIAYSTFKFDRYHLDGRFDPEKASERYAYWVNNSYNDGEDILYLDYNGNSAGFSVINISRDKAYLGLIGLDTAYKGKGLGISLFSATCQYIKDKGVKEVSTTASLNNISALNMYAQCGFRFRDPVYVLHKWL